MKKLLLIISITLSLFMAQSFAEQITEQTKVTGVALTELATEVNAGCEEFKVSLSEDALLDLEDMTEQFQSTPCCRVCKRGKACGDSCIAKNLTCHKGRGCACNG